MNKHQGSCLCGSVRWEFSGQPLEATHCHCSMCRKAHGAAFGTYYNLPENAFRWTGAMDTVRTYRSSETIERPFCSTCGSALPFIDKTTGIRVCARGLPHPWTGSDVPYIR